MDSNRHLAALVTFARAANILCRLTYDDGAPMLPSVPIHSPRKELLDELLPAIQDFPGCVTRLDPGTAVIALELAGMARIAIFTDDPRVTPEAPPSDLSAVERSMRRWDHEQLAGTAVVIGAAGTMPRVRAQMRTPAAPRIAGVGEAEWSAANRQRIDTIGHEDDPGDDAACAGDYERDRRRDEGAREDADALAALEQLGGEG